MRTKEIGRLSRKRKTFIPWVDWETIRAASDVRACMWSGDGVRGMCI